MARLMFDGVTPASVPAGAAIYAGYVGGEWPSYAALAAAHPAALHVSIAVNADEDARVLDVESGDATPAQAPGWATAQRKGGNPYPVIYMDEANWPAVKAAFAGQGVAAPLYWVAAYVKDPTKVPAIPAGAIAVQYYDYGGYDASVVADNWPGLDPDTEGDDMPLTPADVDLILDTPIARAGHTASGAEVGLTSLRNLVAWSDAGIQGTRDELTAVEGTIEKTTAPVVDAAELAAALAGNAVFVSAIAAAVVARIGADLKPTA